MYHIHTLADKAKILAYLETDRNYAAYAMGDLETGFFEQSTWHVAEKDGAICALALVFAGFDPPILVLMGSSEGVAALLGGPVQVARACPMAQQEHLATLSRYYHWDENELWPMWRMVQVDPLPLVREEEGAKAIPLTLTDADRLRALYTLGGGDAFAPSQIAQGVFYGIEHHGQLVAAAGTHLISATYGVAAVGNVMTHPRQRGQGYATLATQAVCAELACRRIQTIVLNVGQDNPAAIRVYEKLGFVRHCAFYEGMIKKR
jgi:ribosomal protein S18 acetylase RimI-like enzyme